MLGSRSGDVTPGGSSRPGSAMSTSTTASGVILRRPAAAPRKPRPASIAGTGMTQESKFQTINYLKWIHLNLI